MKINTITSHDVYNHGASLQAFALQRFLRSEGHEVKVIDYKPAYLNQRSRFTAISPYWASKTLLVRLAYYCYQLPKRLRWRLLGNCQREFDLFTQEYLPRTRRYGNLEELRADPPLADLYLVGSDQVWNTVFWNGRDPAFYLDFGPSETARASYAASFGTSKISPGFEEFVEENLKRFDRISVREDSGLSILQELGFDQCEHVVDPVFLLDADQWCELKQSNLPKEEPYLLVYDFEGSREFENLAKSIAKDRGLKIFSISNSSKTKYADIDFYESGPRTFLSLIKNASVVLSNSFHATAFSIIFNREFWVVPRTKDGVNSRMESLLRSVEATDRIFQFPLAWRGASPKTLHARSLQHGIERSKGYLRNLVGTIQR